MLWAMSMKLKTIFYLNRTLLLDQTMRRAFEMGLPIGVRAAGYDDYYDWSAPIQIASTDTEFARVHTRKIWERFKAALVIVDELHLQKRAKMQAIIDGHKLDGAVVVGMTATPIDVGHMADELVVSGTLQEYRDCKALVPAIVKGIEHPDLSKVKRNATGEFVLDGQRRRIYTQSIIANVIDRWKKYNPDARPTLAYWPGVAESVWGTQQFVDAGVSWAHIDATDAVVDGGRTKLTRSVWRDLTERFKAGDIKGISSRFKAREGLDFPFAYHAIFATPIGSLASYLQTVGRVLRYSEETPDMALVTDHGGAYLYHGSPNHDRDWRAWWGLPESVVSKSHTNSIKERKEREPIRCPQCEGERLRGSKCPFCGFEHEKSVRKVVFEDGSFKTYEREHFIKPRNRQSRHNTAKLWSGLIHGHLRKVARGKSEGTTFAQMEAWFYRENHYYPPRDIPMMPKNEWDWHRKIHMVGVEGLL